MRSPGNRQRLLYIVVGLVLGAIATSLVWAASGATADVRLAARVHDDGRVEVALQQQRLGDESAEPNWGDLQPPRRRFVSRDAEPGRWYYSSSLTLEVDSGEEAMSQDAMTEPDAGPPAVTEIGPFEIVGTPTGNRPFTSETLFCAVTHGNPGDFFWFQVYSAFADAVYWNDINLRAVMEETGVDQAAAIDQCVEDGAAAIATSLADVDALRDSLKRATDAGVRVVSFNSGADQATAVGASVHVALDEVAVGRVAAEEFVRHDVSGDLLCIIHEPANRGLEQRCETLERTYEGGDVIRVRLTESEDDARTTIANAITGGVGGALALNANTAYELVNASRGNHSDLVLAAVTADFPQPLAMLYNGQLSFILWSHALEQGYHTVTALLFAHGSPFPREIGLLSEAVQIAIQPTVITADSVRPLVDDQDNQFRVNLPAWIDALERDIAAGSDAGEDSGEHDDG